MKRNIVIILILIMAGSYPSMAQYDPDYKLNERRSELYSRKITTYSKMRKVGLGLGLAGGVLTVAGVSLVSSADWETTSYGGSTSTTTTDSEGVAGLLMLVVGVPLAVTGIVLGSIGSAKVKSYSKKLNGLSFNIDYTPHRKGVILTYRF